MDQVRDKAWEQVWEHLENRSRAQVEVHVWKQVQGRAETQVQSQVWREACGHVWRQGLSLV